MTQLTERLDRFEHRLRDMDTELMQLRRLAQEPPQVSQTEEPIWETLAPEAPPIPELQPAEFFEAPVRARKEREPFDLTVLLGARALAWTGGAVTLLGVVFFFVLAVERGWIGQSARVSLGALASAALIGAGLWVRRAYGDTYASVSAVGAGVAGLYVTLLAAGALYHLLPAPAALVAAATIAAIGGAIAIAWSSQTLAGLGLVGAMLVPIPIALQQDRVTAVGTAFALLVLVAATVVAVRRDWRGLHLAAIVATAPQGIALAVDHRPFAALVVTGLWVTYGAGAGCLALRTRLNYLPASLLLFSAAFGGWSAALLYAGTGQGIALLAVAAVYAAASLALFRRDRDTSSLLWAIALTVAAMGAASLTSGATLTIVWAAEAAILAWLAKRIAEPRFQLASVAWLTLAYFHALTVDAPFDKLFVANDSAWHATPSAASLAVAATLIGLSAFDWEPRAEGRLARLFADLRAAQPWLPPIGLALGGATAVYAASLSVVALPSSWDWGHVAVAGLWGGVAVTLALLRHRLPSLVAAAATVVLVLAYDLPRIAEVPRSWSFAIVAAAALIVALAYELGSTRTIELPSLTGLAASGVLSTTAVVGLLDGRSEGAGLLALAVLYAVLGVAVVGRRRNFASALGIVALMFAGPASIELLDGSWLVLAWVALCIGLAFLARFEERLGYGAAVYLGLALVHLLVFEAQPSDLFVAHEHPGSGIPAVLLVLAAAAALAWTNERVRAAATWLAGTLGLYAATLLILEVSERLGGGVDTAFQRGHTAVSSLWGIVGLTLLYVGLKRTIRPLQFGGFALFGISLAKLFIYDLAFLSSISRAFSFLAVGAVILVGGLFYQRMAHEPRPSG